MIYECPARHLEFGSTKDRLHVCLINIRPPLLHAHMHGCILNVRLFFYSSALPRGALVCQHCSKAALFEVAQFGAVPKSWAHDFAW